MKYLMYPSVTKQMMKKFFVVIYSVTHSLCVVRVPKAIKVTLGRLGRWGRWGHQVSLAQRGPEEL